MYLHSTATKAQGSQPIFLPNGNLVVIYWNFATRSFYVVTSTDGGATFGTPQLIASANLYNEPSIRNGSFLPSAVCDRTNGNLYMVYQALFSGNPRIVFTQIHRRRGDLDYAGLNQR